MVYRVESLLVFSHTCLDSSLALGLVVAMPVINTPNPSYAQSNAQICRNLQSQLASLDQRSTRSGNSRDIRQYNSAIRKQKSQINKAKRSLQQK